MNSLLDLAGIQYDIAWEDKEKNFTKVQNLISTVPFQNGLIVLPETFATGFTMQSEKFSETQLGRTENFLLEQAKKSNNLIAAGWIEKNPEGKPFNTLSVASPKGEILYRYRKIHSFSLAGEDIHFAAGNQTLNFEYNEFKISPLICYDLRFPEIFRENADSDLFIVIANWPEIRIEHWLSLLKARAIENQAYVLGVNRIGIAGRKKFLHHNGNTVLYDWNGNETKTNLNTEECLITKISLEDLKEVREKLPFLKDRKKNQS
jgi:omega-amidase